MQRLLPIAASLFTAQATLQTLRDCVRSSGVWFVTNTDPSFEEISQVFNHVWHAKSSLLAVPRDTRDTARIVRCASVNNRTVTPRSGGYSLGGYSAGTTHKTSVSNLTHNRYE
eukprot:Gregarina_sp_Poly_1__1216@NODE_1299_length_4435_cov_13_644231_g879_i0_p5_GENE_NODE_1299_length_4435_cov_13_644231_g879_i0NODE_1299_length_4435_cov_13_644231_g879_i0_p5_ORF_typecomplete_len113_score0_50FAD_binding_4/PF01565_23/1_5e05_NODE_1299_length_4435_cov_13_644231_g879_i034372